MIGMIRKVRIESDGSIYGTRVYDSVTGDEIKNVSSLTIHQSAGMPMMADLVQQVFVESATISTDADIETNRTDVSLIGGPRA